MTDPAPTIDPPTIAGSDGDQGVGEVMKQPQSYELSHVTDLANIPIEHLDECLRVIRGGVMALRFAMYCGANIQPRTDGATSAMDVTVEDAARLWNTRDALPALLDRIAVPVADAPLEYPPDMDHRERLRMAEAEIVRLREASRWADIGSVPTNRPVLLSYENGFMLVDTARWNEDGKQFFAYSGHDPAITHWMELPDPPNPQVDRAGAADPIQAQTTTSAGSESNDLLGGLPDQEKNL